MMGSKLLIIFVISCSTIPSSVWGSLYHDRVKRQVEAEPETRDSIDDARGGIFSSCSSQTKLRCKGSLPLSTCDNFFNTITQTYSPRCLSGLDGDGDDISNLVSCCTPCCDRPGGNNVYKWCEEISEEDFTCRAYDCLSLRQKGERRDGVYDFQQGSPLEHAWCDMNTDGGGWTVIQSRVDGSVLFNRSWTEYQVEFGDLGGNYWMGLDKINELTKQPVELYIYIRRFDGKSAYAKYSSFSISDSATKYALDIGGYSGTAGNSLTYHNGMQYSTWDQDNDRWGHNCAVRYEGAWWYNACHHSNLNGRYFPSETQASAANRGMRWHTFNGEGSLYHVKMMIRPYRDNGN